MIKGTLVRVKREENQTRGYLDLYRDDKRIFSCMTLELPYLDNAKNISCIYTGIFECNYYESPSKGDTYLLRNVVDRSFIEIHSGNYHFDILGCILVGDNFFDLNKDGLKDVTNSKHTLNRMFELTQKETIYLTIVNQY